jgi:hypothetical protein
MLTTSSNPINPSAIAHIRNCNFPLPLNKLNPMLQSNFDNLFGCRKVV